MHGFALMAISSGKTEEKIEINKQGCYPFHKQNKFLSFIYNRGNYPIFYKIIIL